MKAELRTSRWKVLGFLAAAVALTLAGTLAAIAAQGTSGSEKAREAAAPPDLKVNVAGMQVAIDPATGKLRPPTAEESRALAEALHQQFAPSSRPLTVIQAANGALALELTEDYMETALLRIHPDGSTTIDCMSPAEAERIIGEEGPNPEGAGAPGIAPAPTSASGSGPAFEEE
jgi:hypothetical protein